MKFYNNNEEIVNNLDNKITSHGASKKSKLEDNTFIDQIGRELEGYNIIQFFSLSKIPNDSSVLKFKKRIR